MNEDFLPIMVREFRRLKKLADDAIAQTSTERFFACPAKGDNSVAVIVKHVGGNLRSRWTDFLTSDGEKPSRSRDQEFIVAESDTREALLAQWEEGWATLFRALEPLSSTDFGRRVTIRHESMTAFQAINRQLSHYAYHIGQIVYVAKHFAGVEWQSLSIPVGQSEAFNRALAARLSKG